MKQFYICIFSSLFCIQLFAQVPAFKTVISANAPGGYYFVAPMVMSPPSAKCSYNVILDSAGNVVYYKYFDSNALARGFCIQPNGFLSYFNGKRDRFILRDSTFTVTDSVRAQNGDSTDCHELQILPNGHYLILGIEKATMNLNKYFLFGHGSQGSIGATVYCAIIQELDKNKKVVFEWHAKDHFPFDSVDPFFMSSGSVVDWTHANALELDYDGNILMSSRNFNEITKINRKDGSIIWRFGGKYNQFKFIGDSVPFYGQHDVRRISNGNITLFDDGKHTIYHGARACEYKLDEKHKTAQLVWSSTYDSSMYSQSSGSVQRLESGATLINYGELQGNVKDNVCFSVVDTDGKNLFKLVFKDKLFSYRSFHYSSLPWSLCRPVLTCFTSGDTLYLDAGSGYGSYKWSTGDTTETIAVTKPGAYYVFVQYGQGKGGFISSEKMNVTDIHNACGILPASQRPPEKGRKKLPPGLPLK